MDYEEKNEITNETQEESQAAPDAAQVEENAAAEVNNAAEETITNAGDEDALDTSDPNGSYTYTDGYVDASVLDRFEEELNDSASGAFDNSTNATRRPDAQDFAAQEQTGQDYTAEQDASAQSAQGYAYDQAGQYQYSYEGSDNTAKKPAKEKRKKTPMQITKAGFVLVLILCMILTSGLTVGGLYYFTDGFKSNSGGNVVLTTSDETLSYKSIVEMCQDSVVSITTESVTTDSWMRNYVTTGAGSGIVISEDGYILTCSHVVNGASNISVTMSDGTQYNATIIGEDEEQDVAVIKINASGLSAVTIGDSDELEVGDVVVAIGNPLGTLGGTVTTGIISATNRSLTIEGQTMTLLQTDASINPGNSGGALFDAYGKLIGVVEAKSTGSDVEGLGFAIPVNTAMEIANDIIETGGNVGSTDNAESTHGQIGIMVATLTEDQAASYNYDGGAGLYISQITSKYAQDAGLQIGDKIVACEGKAISEFEDLSSILENTSAGDEVTLTIYRDGSTSDVTVTLS